MENASKALLIAGAVLLMLSIITLSVLIFGKGKVFVTTMDRELSQAEIENHNAKFLRYNGNVSGAEVKNACLLVAQNNQDNPYFEVTMTVRYNGSTITFSKTSNKINEIMNNIPNTNSFRGNLSYNSQGIIDAISFE